MFGAMIMDSQNRSCVVLLVILLSVFLAIRLKESSGKDETFFNTEFMAATAGKGQ